jgi:hypothetical protein
LIFLYWAPLCILPRSLSVCLAVSLYLCLYPTTKLTPPPHSPQSASPAPAAGNAPTASASTHPSKCSPCCSKNPPKHPHTHKASARMSTPCSTAAAPRAMVFLFRFRFSLFALKCLGRREGMCMRMMRIWGRGSRVERIYWRLR